MQTDYLQAVKALIPADKLEEWGRVMCKAAGLAWDDLTEDDRTLPFQFAMAVLVQDEVAEVMDGQSIAAKLTALMAGMLSDEPDPEGENLVRFAQAKERQGTHSRWAVHTSDHWYIAMLGQLIVQVMQHSDEYEREQLIESMGMVMAAIEESL